MPPPSRQERRRAERDAEKRTPAQAGATGAATAARADVYVSPLGDWTTQADDPFVGPSGYCLARHVMGVQLTRETTFKVR